MDGKGQATSKDFFDADYVTERLPVAELWEDGVEPPEDDEPRDRDQAA